MPTLVRSRRLRRGLLALSTAVLGLNSQTSYAQNGAVAIARPIGGIVIDGDLKDWPEGLPIYPIERVEFGDKAKGKEDFKASFRVAVNAAEHALYVAVEVEDESSLLDGPGEPSWDGQDGCEIFLNAVHAPDGSPFLQYARYGNKNRIVGPLEIPEKTLNVAVARSEKKAVYEWKVELPVDLDPDRVLGFDISVGDKDADGSFSWVAWGPGTQKISSADRCGEILIVKSDTKFGDITGQVAWKDPSGLAFPTRVQIQSTRSPQFWRNAAVDPTGTYKASGFPEGPYTVRAVDSPELRVETGPNVEVSVEAGKVAKADVLKVTPIPWPGLIGDEGILRSSAPVDPAQVDKFIKAYLDYYKTPGISLAIIQGGKVVYHRGFGLKDASKSEPVTEETVFEAASMTKPVFAYSVLRLVDRGVLDLDTPLYKYLPYEDIAHDDRYKLITARMVLTHRTGFPNWRTGKLDIKFTPGTQVSYSGEGFVYLGKVVEKLTGKTLVDIVREEVFEPFDMKNASLVYNDNIARLTAIGHDGRSPLPKWKVAEPNTAASLHVDAGNYCKFLISVMEGKGLSEAMAKEMLKTQVVMPDAEKASWGLGIAIQETPVGIHYGHGGRNTGFTSLSLMYKDLGAGYVFLVNNDDEPKYENILNAFLFLGKSGLKESSKVTHKAIKIDPKLFEDLVGDYELGHETTLTFTLEDGHFYVQPQGDKKMEIYAESTDTFFLSPTEDTTFKFVKDEQGKFSQVDLHRNGRNIKAKRLVPDAEPKAKAEPTK
ncbi:serine hydrolase [Singulisphaera sp. PoT]|uniref:serine hydrolase n=1 Tax=Singulisphaera sp. PoT TaxID=3411797 RepID=UPI003BF4800E